MTPIETELATEAAQRVVEIHRRLAGFLAVGQTLGQIDGFVGEALRSLGAKSAFLHYRTGRYPRFPSHACLSVNDVVVHGTAAMSTSPLTAGDIISIDIGVKYRGWIGDAAWTYILQRGDEEATRLCMCGREALSRGIAKLQPGHALVEWAREVQTVVEEEYGYYCVEGLGGHGYGRELHTPPYIANAVARSTFDWPDMNFRLVPGMLIAVEPMVAVGTRALRQNPREWPIRTADGSRSVHYEHDVLISEEGPVVLTEGLDALPTEVG